MVLPPEKAVPDSVTVPGQLVTQPELIGKRVRVIGLDGAGEGGERMDNGGAKQ